MVKMVNVFVKKKLSDDFVIEYFDNLQMCYLNKNYLFSLNTYIKAR